MLLLLTLLSINLVAVLYAQEVEEVEVIKNGDFAQGFLYWDIYPKEHFSAGVFSFTGGFLCLEKIEISALRFFIHEPVKTLAMVSQEVMIPEADKGELSFIIITDYWNKKKLKINVLFISGSNKATDLSGWVLLDGLPETGLCNGYSLFYLKYDMTPFSGAKGRLVIQFLVEPEYYDFKFYLTRVSIRVKKPIYYPVRIHDPLGVALGNGTYKSGSKISVRVTSNMVTLQNRTRYVFQGWVGSITSNASIVNLTVDSPKELSVVWLKEYYVSFNPPYSHCSGWYKAGAAINCSIYKILDYKNRTRDIFVGLFADNKSINSIIAYAPVNISAVYRRQYLVETRAIAEVSGLSFGLDPQLIEGGGWYDAGSTALVKAPRALWIGRGSILPLTFEEWRDSVSFKQEVVQLKVDSPKVLVAVYKVQRILLPAILALAFLMLTAIVIFRGSEKVKNYVSGLSIRIKRRRTVTMTVENVVRNIESFRRWLSNREQVHADKVLTMLKKHVEGPLKSLEDYFGDTYQFKELMKEVHAWAGVLESRRGSILGKKDIEELVLAAEIWVVSCRNLHYELDR
jgi:hypothetical protein